MRVEILFLHNNDNDIISIRDVKNVLNSIAGIVIDNNCISFDGNEIVYNMELSANKKYVVLTLELENENQRNAAVLSKAKQIIRSGEHRASHNIIVSYDESTIYFNRKLFSFISKNESKLRQLVYLILIDAFGSDWVKQTLDETQQSDLKENLRCNRLIERGLEAFSYQEYITFLFEKRANSFTNELIDKIIERIKLDEEIDKDWLIQLLEKNKSFSLWESDFSGIDYDEAEKDINLIRSIRNAVMHNKEISLEEFTNHKKILKKSNRDLDTVLEYVKSERRVEIQPIEVLISLQNTIANIGAQYAALINPMIEAVNTINESISKIYNSSAFKMAQETQSKIVKLMPTYHNIYGNNSLRDAFLTMEKTQQRYISLLSKIKPPRGLDLSNVGLPWWASNLLLDVQDVYKNEELEDDDNNSDPNSEE